MEEAIDIFMFCANSTIPSKIYTNRKKGIHGWNDFVKPYKDESLWWHDVWKSVGSPTTGPLADKRRLTRSRYHWAVKKARKDTDMLILNESAKQLESKSFREFWKTMKRLKGNSKVSSNVIDGICNEQDIANNFQKIYKDLYNSVNDKDLNDVVSEMNDLVMNQCNREMSCISLP